MGVVVSLHDQLMRPADHLQVVFVVELVCDVLSPTVTRSSWTWAESVSSLIGRVWPQQVAQSAIVRNVLDSVDGSYLVEWLNFRWKSSVKTKNLVFYDSCDGQVLEDLSEHFPYLFGSVLVETLIVEAIKLVDFSVFVISSQESDSVLVHDF